MKKSDGECAGKREGNPPVRCADSSCCGARLFRRSQRSLEKFDRGHSLAFLPPPPAAGGSLPLSQGGLGGREVDSEEGRRAMKNEK